MKLFYNGIVKNESTRILRMLNSIIDYVDGAIVLDTGSTDDTIPLIGNFFRERDKPCTIAIGTFETWEQARNDALALARRSDLPWSHLLLVDADMELVVNDPNWVGEVDGCLGAMEMVQQAGTVVYSNARVLSRASNGVYRGVTHEYLDVPSTGCVKGASFRDHADGANRTGKALRDAALLRGGLEKEPQNGRYWYYLGQSLRDAGQPAEAIPAFVNCVRHSTWDEEKWNAQVNLAHCYNNLGDEARFVLEMLRAYDMRPSRAEALYDLAKHFREKGKNHASIVFSEMGLLKPMPPDRLFVNAYPYKVGFKEEYAICGFYDSSRKELARKYNDELSLSLHGEGPTRFCARANMYHYLQPLKELCPGMEAERIDFTPPDGYVGMNPSISQYGEISVRCVNYTITEHGQYAIRSSKDGSINRENPIHTRNFVLPRGEQDWKEVIFQEYPILFDLVVGAEDMRLFRWNDGLWSLSNFRDRNPEGRCEQHIAQIDPKTGTAYHIRKVEPKDFPASYAEKNWMPWVCNTDLRFIYRLGTVLDLNGHVTFQSPPIAIDVQRLSGGGTPAQMPDGNWIVILHEAQPLPGQDYKRYYYHRFAALKPDGMPMALSRPFVFHEKQIEFAAGTAVLDGKLWITYGVRDQEPWLATIPLEEVARLFS